MTESEVALEAEAFTSRAEIKDVRVTRWLGEVSEDFPGGDIEQSSTEVHGQYRFAGSALQCRWNVEFPLSVEHRKNVALIAVTLVETFSVMDGPQPSPEVLSLFMRSVALSIAMPYFREALETMGQRLGLGSIVIGLVKEPGTTPRSASHRSLQAPIPALPQ